MWNNQGSYGNYDQAGGFESPGGFSSPQSSQQSRARTRTQNIIPVTIGMVHQCEHEDEKFHIDGMEISQVTIVGLVRSVQQGSNRMDYKLDDLTGPPMEIRLFVDIDEANPDEAERIRSVRENTYVRLFGHVRAFQGKKNVVAFRIQPLTDMNELTTHILEVIQAHMATKAQAAAGAGDSTSRSADTGSTYSGAQGNIPANGLTPVQAQVAQTITDCRDEQGVSVIEIAKQLQGMSQKAIRDAIDFLSSEGHIYSTIDDDHYKATDS